ncbi:NADH:ubiquinone oxidoreductase [Azotobacter chroococcum]|nr:NADH:ubiquinone oxidoreductase [Azotobacter chroococcum]
MRPLLLLLSLALSGQALADACTVHSRGERVEVRICQENRSIPAKLFREGFCQPQLAGQQVEVSFAEHCPQGSFGVCREVRVKGTPYRQDIHYYGVASDARYLKPACEGQSGGRWITP